MVPSKQQKRIEELQEELRQAVEEERELLDKRMHRLVLAQTPAERESIKALYRELLAPVRKRKNRASNYIKWFAEREAKRKASPKDTISERIFGKRRAELSPKEKAAYNTYMKKRSRFRKKMTGE